MRRRRFLLAGAGAGLALAGGAALLPPATVARLPDWEAAERWLAALEADPAARSVQGWALPRVLEHLAQSIGYAIDGYPQLQPGWFRHGPGAVAGGLFQRLGRMRHDLEAPIPGAPPLGLDALPAGLAALRGAIARFRAHRGALAPHFAYGELDHAAYTRAHLMHLADHARWIVPHA
jgi:hypothetical protein